MATVDTLRMATAEIRNGTTVEVPPPGVGLKTVTLAVPDAATSKAGMSARN